MEYSMGLDVIAVQLEQQRNLERDLYRAHIEKNLPRHEYVMPETGANLGDAVKSLEKVGYQAAKFAWETVAGKDAFAGGDDYFTKSVSDFYKDSSPVNDPNMPEGLRVHPFGEGLVEITTKESKLPSNYDNGNFTKYFFGAKYGEGLRRIFEKHGFRRKNVENFLGNHRDEKSVSFYFDGFMLLFDSKEKNIYSLPINQSLISDIKAL